MKKGRVTGIGGVFFKSADPKGLQTWYEEQLGLPKGADGYNVFPWRPVEPSGGTSEDAGAPACTIWSPFPRDTTYFAPSAAPFMINYRVDDLDALLERLRAAGVTVDDKVDEYPYGRFGWVMDPEGNRIELWEPAEATPDD